MFENSIYELTKDPSCILGINAENDIKWISPICSNPTILKEFKISEQINWPDFYTKFIALTDKNFTIDIEFLLTDITYNQYIFGQDTPNSTFSLLALAQDSNGYSTIRLFAKNIIEGQIFTAYDIYKVLPNVKTYLQIKRNNGILTISIKENNVFKTLYTEYNAIQPIKNLPIISNGLPVFSKFNGKLFHFSLKDENNQIIYKLSKSDLFIQLPNLGTWPNNITENSPSGSWEIQTQMLIPRNVIYNSNYHGFGFNNNSSEKNWDIQTQLNFKNDRYNKTFIVNCLITNITNKNSIEYQTIFSQGTPTNLFNIIHLSYIADRTSDNSGKNDYIIFKVNNTSCIIPYEIFKNYFNTYITLIGIINFNTKKLELYFNNNLISETDFLDKTLNDNQENTSTSFKIGGPNILNINNKNIFIKNIQIFNEAFNFNRIKSLNFLFPKISYINNELPPSGEITAIK